MPPTPDEAEAVFLPQPFGRCVEIANGEYHMVDPEHRPNLPGR
jgi:hypothetical protein